MNQHRGSLRIALEKDASDSPDRSQARHVHFGILASHMRLMSAPGFVMESINDAVN